jgi:hypothetical protein
MTNAFFNHTSRFIAGTAVRASESNARLDEVSTGFEAVETELSKAVRMAIAVPAFVVPPGGLQNKFMGFDSSGQPFFWDKAVLDALLAEVTALRAATAADAATASEQATTALNAVASSEAIQNGTYTVNGQSGPTVVLTAADVGAAASSEFKKVRAISLLNFIGYK